MKQYIALLLLIVSAGGSYAASNKIVAIVNSSPITSEELYVHKTMVQIINNIPTLSADQEKKFTEEVLKSMIDQLLVRQEAKNFGITIEEDELNNALTTIEKERNLPSGYIRANLPKVVFSEFAKRIESDLLRMQLVGKILSPTIKISRSEVVDMAILAQKQEANLVIYTASTADLSKKAFATINKTHNKLSKMQCMAPKAQDIKGVEKLETTLEALSPKMKAIARDLEVGGTSSIIENDGKLFVMKLCAKNLAGLSEDSSSQIYSMIGDHKLRLKAEKYFHDLKHKAYISIK